MSFSGGKDSTVLLDIVRSIYSEVPAVFIDTGLEYPEVRDFVRQFDNVEWLNPIIYDKTKRKYKKISFNQVIEQVGYPVISKECSKMVYEARNNPNCRDAQKFDDNSDYIKRYGKRFSLSRWKFLLDAPFKISSKCCDIMKKNPAKQYEKATGRKPIIGMMANESAMRKSKWLQEGCNAFDNKRPSSNPMSFWTEQDVLLYLNNNHDDLVERYRLTSNHPWASVYGELKQHNNGKFEFTGNIRTGCMFCMYGIQIAKQPNNFQRMKTTHPKQYEYCMKPKEEGGLGLAEVLQYIGIDYE